MQSYGTKTQAVEASVQLWWVPAGAARHDQVWTRLWGLCFRREPPGMFTLSPAGASVVQMEV